MARGVAFWRRVPTCIKHATLILKYGKREAIKGRWDKNSELVEALRAAESCFLKYIYIYQYLLDSESDRLSAL